MVCSDRHATAIAGSLSIPWTRAKTVTALGEVSGDRAGWKGDMPMPAKYKGQYVCTRQQMQQIYETYDYLRELHRDIYRALQQPSGSTDTDKGMAVFFCRGAGEIGGALKVLAEISNSAQEQVPRVVFEVSVVCSDCIPAPDQSKDDPVTGIPAPDPAYLLKLDHLFNLANRSGRRRSRRMRHRNSPDALSKGHQKLVAALIKERRYFRETAAAPPPAIEWRDNGPDCSVCHQPVKIIDDPMKR
jgi:hypothetical protein